MPWDKDQSKVFRRRMVVLLIGLFIFSFFFMRRPILMVGIAAIAVLFAGVAIRKERQTVPQPDGFLKKPTQETASPIVANPLTSTSDGKENVKTGDYTYQFKTADGERSYLVHVPPQYDATKAIPVLLHLHGGMGTPESSDASTGFSTYSDKRGFLLVYGQGTRGRIGLTSWNAGGCCGTAQEKNNNIDDVGYVREVLKQVAEKYHVDTKRIYVSGMSNGSMMGNRLVCEAADLLAGVATVSGTTQVTTCKPSRPVPHIMIHGTADTNVPYNGGKSGSPFNSGTFVSVEDEFKTWSERNGCTGSIMTTEITPKQKDGTSADKLVYSHCPANREAVLYRVNGGGHSWPGGSASSNKLEHTAPSQALNASAVILDFFGL